MTVVKSMRESFKIERCDVRYKNEDLSFLIPYSDVGVIDEILGQEDSYHLDVCVPPGSNVVDLGANIGVFTIACLTRGCRVYAVEASPLNFALLRLNVDWYSHTHDVPWCPVLNRCVGTRLHDLSAAARPAKLFATNTEHFSGSITGPAPFEPDHERWLYSDVEILEPLGDLRLRPGSSYDFGPGLAFPTWNASKVVLKIDIEGTEKEIFIPRYGTFFQQADVVLLEWHEYDGHVYAEYLEKLGFKVILTGCGYPQPAYDKTFGRGMLYAVRR